MKSKIITVLLSLLMICGITPVSAINLRQNFTSISFSSSEKQYISLDDKLDYIPNTMEAWIKLDNNPNKRQIILGNYRDTTHSAFSIEITADNQLRYFEQIMVDGKKIEYELRTTDFTCNDQWTHIAVVRDPINQVTSLLVNGEVRANKKSDVIREKPALSDSHFVGTDHRKNYFLDGEIHSLSLWNQTKSADEIIDDMNKEITGTESNLFHAWNFNDDILNTDGVLRDLVSENKVDGTVFGFEVLGLEIKKLEEKIASYLQLIENSDVIQEKKDIFTQTITEVQGKLNEVTSIAEINELAEILQKAYSDFGEPINGNLDFVVLSDTHVQASASSTSARIYDAGLNDIVTTMPNVKAVVNCGDFSSDGADSEFDRYYSIINKYDENLQFINALGNHDVRWTSQGWDGVYNRYMSYNQKYMGDTDKVYYDTWVGEGDDKYHFIVLNTEWDIKDSSYISNEQLAWLDKTMAEGAQDNKPIFIALHEPLRNTIANTDSYNGESDFPLDAGPQDYALKEILRKYPQTVLFTGHVHAGLGKNEIVKTDYGTLVNVPSYLRPDSGDSQNQVGYYVSVYDGKVQLSMRDFEHDIWLPEYHYTIDLTDEVPAGKVLDVTFDDKTANDSTNNGNDGKIVGDVEFVEGVKGKAIHLVNEENDAKQYVDFGKIEDLSFGKDDFTIMFYYKGTKEMGSEGAIIANKNWDTGANPGFAVGTFTDPRPGIGLNFAVEGSSRKDTERYDAAIDGNWHHVAATFDRDGKMTLYIDGKISEEVDISEDNGKTIDVEELGFILGADGNLKYPVNDCYIDELKVYKKVIEAYEIESIVAPYKIQVEENKAIITWDALDTKFVPAYFLFNGEKINISSDASSYEINGLEPNTKYSVEVITRDRQYTRNLVFGHELEFKTTGSVNKEELQSLYDECLALNETDYTESSWKNLSSVMDEVKTILTDTQASQEDVDNAFKLLSDAKAALVKVEDVNTDKKALKIALDKANEITDEDLANVVPVVVEEFKAAREEANSVYNNVSATQEQVNNAFDRLASAMQKLEFFKGDKTALEAFVNKVTGLNKDSYTKATWEAFEAALNNANKVLADENALETEVNEAYDSLVRAFLDLRLIPNKDLLNDLINKAESLEAVNYTADTFKAMQEALNNAKAVAVNENVTQAEVDKAKDVLAKAIASLQANTPATDNKVSSLSNGDTTSVKTGDDNLISLLAGLSLLSVIGVNLLRRKEN